MGQSNLLLLPFPFDAMKKYDFLIVGSGLFGACFAHRARALGKRCLVIDKRPHLGGNVYCEQVAGISVHQYGAHIFHTSNKAVWDFVNSFVPFNAYVNSPLAKSGDKLYNLPFNMNTFYQMWGVVTPQQAAEKIEQQRAQAKAKMQAEGVTQPRNLEEQALLLVGEDIYKTLIESYTQKQWGRPCTDLPAFIIKRLPLRFTFDNNYFNDLYQGVPIGGYNKLIEGLLEGVETRCNADYFEDRATWDALADRLVFTGRLDEFYACQFGPLEYRSLRFEQELLDVSNYQGNAVVNEMDAQVPHTRIIEHKHFEMFGAEVDACPRTVISREFPLEYQVGLEPYYPINDDKNTQRVAQYKALAAQEENVIFGGRLAEYCYYDMAPIIEKVLSLEIS